MQRAIDISGDEELPAHAFSLNSARVRSLRKHRVAFIALAVYHFVFFFPTLFMHRVVSPNDVFFSYAPWSAVRAQSSHAARAHATTNPSLDQIPVSSNYACFKLERRTL